MKSIAQSHKDMFSQIGWDTNIFFRSVTYNIYYAISEHASTGHDEALTISFYQAMTVKKMVKAVDTMMYAIDKAGSVWEMEVDVYFDPLH